MPCALSTLRMSVGKAASVARRMSGGSEWLARRDHSGAFSRTPKRSQSSTKYRLSSAQSSMKWQSARSRALSG